jgi:hypothetical protein
MTAGGELAGRCVRRPGLGCRSSWESESKRGSVRLPGRKFQSHPAVPPGRLIEEGLKNIQPRDESWRIFTEEYFTE